MGGGGREEQRGSESHARADAASALGDQAFCREVCGGLERAGLQREKWAATVPCVSLIAWAEGPRAHRELPRSILKRASSTKREKPSGTDDDAPSVVASPKAANQRALWEGVGGFPPTASPSQLGGRSCQGVRVAAALWATLTLLASVKRQAHLFRVSTSTSYYSLFSAAIPTNLLEGWRPDAPRPRLGQPFRRRSPKPPRPAAPACSEAPAEPQPPSSTRRRRRSGRSFAGRRGRCLCPAAATPASDESSSKGIHRLVTVPAY